MNKNNEIPEELLTILISSKTLDENGKWHGHKVTYNGVNLMVEGFENTPEYKAIRMNTAITALGFKGIGPATAELLSSLKLSDIMAQNPEGLKIMLLNTGNFKEGRELTLIIEAFFALTEVELWQVIYSFGYRNCGKTISKELAKYMLKQDHSFKGLEKKVVEAFVNDEERIKEVKEFVEILENNNVKVNKPKSTEGLVTFEMTGDTSGTGYGTKAQFAAEVSQYGAVHVALKAETNYLITDSLVSNTGKMQKAKKLGVTIMEYLQFLEFLKSK